MGYSTVPVLNIAKRGLKYSKYGIKEHSSKIGMFLVSY